MKMFARLVWKLLSGSRGRLSVAILALVAGATVISALLNLDLDLQHKLTQEFRAYGANVVLSTTRSGASGARAAGGNVAGVTADAPLLMDANTAMKAIEETHTPQLLAAAPYLYVVARAADTPLVVAGTWLDQTPQLSPSWKIVGQPIVSRDDVAHCLVGRGVAHQLNLEPGSPLDLTYEDRSAGLVVSAVIDSGATEDNQVFVNLPVAQQLAQLRGGDVAPQISLVQLSVGGTQSAIAAYVTRLAKVLPASQFDVEPIRQITEAEGSLLHRIQLLIFSMVLLILVLTALCVLATMAALAMERRQDVGLMKAIGGSISRVVGIFLAEVSVLGVGGGVLGCIAGFALSHWMGRRVFGAAIGARWEIFPLTVVMMVLVALAGALPLRLLGKVKPAVIFRGE